jgi:integrase
MASITKRPDGQWRARYRDDADKEHARHFSRKLDGQRWLDEVTASVVTGTYTDPKTARTTVGEWCDTWLAGYATRRPSTVRQARVHIAQIRAEFGTMPLSAVRPSHVKSWTARLLADGAEASYVYALHGRLAQIFSDAVHDGIVPRSPCSRRTSPGQGKQRAYAATTDQVWALADAMPDRLRAAVLLGAFAGLRLAETCGLRTADVDFMRAVIHPAVQFPAEPLKTETSRTAIPIAQSMALELAAHVKQWPGETLLTGTDSGQLSTWALERAMRTARAKVDGLPAGFRYHDLRHYLASLLIASGNDVKTVQARLRHASAKTTLDTYGHLWPDRDESTRATVEAVFTDRADSVRTAAGLR